MKVKPCECAPAAVTSHMLLTTEAHTLHVTVTLLTVLPTDKAVMKSCNKAVRKIHTEQRHTSHDPHTHFLLVSLFHLCEGKHPVGHGPHRRLPSLIGRTNAMH